jgi:hypothetical protein
MNATTDDLDPTEWSLWLDTLALLLKQGVCLAEASDAADLTLLSYRHLGARRTKARSAAATTPVARA